MNIKTPELTPLAMMMYCDTKEKCFVHNLVFLNWIIVCYYIQQNKTYQNRVSICDSICESSRHADLIYERDEIGMTLFHLKIVKPLLRH